MDKYKIKKTKDGKWAVFTRDYFWQAWKPVCDPLGNPIYRNEIGDILGAVGSAWWKEFYVRVDSIGVF